MLESLRPDPTFHASPRLAMEAEREHIAYAAAAQLGSGLGAAVLVSVVHTAAMLCAGLAAAWVVFRYLGLLRVLSRAWINLDAVWGASLVVAGGASVAMVAMA